jgi:hypothetical protein
VWFANLEVGESFWRDRRLQPGDRRVSRHARQQPGLARRLWALTFGNGANGGDTNILYFTTGLNAETEGLFAALSIVQRPEFSADVADTLVAAPEGTPLRDGRGPRRGAKRRAPEVPLPLASILTVETTPESVAAEKEDPA